MLGINQKRKANPWEIYDYLAKLENVFETTNELMLNSVSEQDYIEVKKGGSKRRMVKWYNWKK